MGMPMCFWLKKSIVMFTWWLKVSDSFNVISAHLDLDVTEEAWRDVRVDVWQINYRLRQTTYRLPVYTSVTTRKTFTCILAYAAGQYFYWMDSSWLCDRCWTLLFTIVWPFLDILCFYVSAGGVSSRGPSPTHRVIIGTSASECFSWTQPFHSFPPWLN